MKSKAAQLTISLIISIGGLWLAFGFIDWSAFKTALADGNLLLISMGSVILLVVIPVRGYRWRIFLKPVADVPLRLTSEATFVGVFGNNALPFRLGELLRSYFVARRIAVPVSQVFGTVIVERVVDFLSALLFFAALPFLGAIPETMRQPMLWVIAISAVLGALTYWLAKRKSGSGLFKGRFKTMAGNLNLGFASLSQGQHHIALLGSTLLLWILYLSSIHVTQYAMGLGLSLTDSYLLLAVITTSMLIPAAPAAVGTFHAAVVIALTSIFGVELAKAQAAAVILHAISFIPYTGIGAVLYVRSQLRIKDINSLEMQPAVEED